MFFHEILSDFKSVQMRFLLESLVSRSFPILLRYSLLFLLWFLFSFFKFLYFFFSHSVLILSWFYSSVPSVIYLLSLFIMSIAHFILPNSIPISCLYILTVYISLLFSFIFWKERDVVRVHKGINLFSCFCKFLAPSALPNWVVSMLLQIVMMKVHPPPG